MRRIVSIIVALLFATNASAGSIVTSGTGGSIVTTGYQIGNGTGNTGFVEFSAASSVFAAGSTVGWTNPTNALTNLGTFANANSISPGDYSYYLHVTNASSALAELLQTSSIDGIEVELSITGDDGGPDEMYDENVQLIIGGTRTGTDKGSHTQLTDTSINTLVYGGPSDLWGLTPTASQLLASDFGVAVRILSDGGSTASVEIYRIRIKVYYSGAVGSIVTLPGEPEVLPDGLIGNSTVLDTNSRNANEFIYSSFTVTTAGQLSYCAARWDPGVTGDDATFGVYDTSGNRLAYFNITNVGATAVDWYEGALNTPIEVGVGEVYILGIVFNQTTSVSKDGTEAGHYRRTIPMTYATTPDATADFSSGNYTSINEASVHNFMCQNDSTIP